MSEDERIENGSAPAAPQRRRVDPVALTAGVLTVAASGYFLLGGPGSWQYVLAVGAVAVGVVMLVSSLRRS